MHIHKLILLLQLLVTCGIAQNGYPTIPYAPNTWEQWKPEWYAPIYCEGTKDSVCDGYNQLFPNYIIEPIIDGPHIYFQYQIFRLKLGTFYGDFFLGTYIEKRNWETGEKLSEMFFQVGKDSITKRQEATVHWQVSNDNLEMMTLKKIRPNGEFPIGDLFGGAREPSKVAKRTYEPNGVLIHHSDPDVTDSLLPSLELAITKRFGFSQYYPLEQNRIEVLKYDLTKDYSTNFYTRFFIDSIGMIISDIDTFLPGTGNVNYTIRRISANQYVIANPDSMGVKFYHLDADFKLKDFYRSPEIGPMKGLLAEYFRDKYVVFNRNKGTPPFDNDYEIIRLDLQGNIINKVSYPDNGSFMVQVNCLECEQDSFFYIVSSRSFISAPNKHLSAVVLKGGATGKMEIIKEERQKNFFRYILPRNALKLPNGNYLVEFAEQAYVGSVGNLDGNARAFSYAVFRPEELGLPARSQTDNTAPLAYDFIINPNPTIENTDIEFDLPFSGLILIEDINGRVVKVIKCESETKIRIDLLDVVTGFYTLRAISNQGLIKVKKLIKH